MIRRIPSKIPTRSRSVIHAGIVSTVAVAERKVPSLYEQTRDALAIIERNLAEAGSHKSKILTAMIYITDVMQKPEMNRAWDEWVDRSNIPMRACVGAGLEGDDLIEIIVTAAV